MRTRSIHAGVGSRSASVSFCAKLQVATTLVMQKARLFLQSRELREQSWARLSRRARALQSLWGDENGVSARPYERGLAMVGELLTIREVARLLRSHPSSVRRWIAGYGLPAVRVGGRVMIARDELSEWLERHRIGKEVVEGGRSAVRT